MKKYGGEDGRKDFKDLHIETEWEHTFQKLLRLAI